MKIVNRIIILLLTGFLAVESGAQAVKSITVRQGEPFTDHISLESDARDMDVMVKFVFNEDSNQLSVSLISYRSLFVFWANTPYKPAVGWGRRIRPDRLSYEVTLDPAAKYKLSKAYKRSVPKPRKKYVFKRWVEYDGLQPAPQEYKMVSDYVEQTFDIQQKRSNVMVKLRNVMLIDKNTKKRKPSYEISYGVDLNLEYHVTIERNPCNGLDEELNAAQTVLSTIKKSYADIRKKFGSGRVSTEKQLAAFQEMKQLLLTQYVRNEGQSPCEDIRTAYSGYNSYIDSIQSMHCDLDSTAGLKAKAKLAKAEGPSARLLTSRARQIDALVSRWLLSGDALQRSDIERQCQDIIEEVTEALGKGLAQSPEQQRALALYRAAEAYYRRTCGRE